jgi:hypothetical protein
MRLQVIRRSQGHAALSRSAFPKRFRLFRNSFTETLTTNGS